MKGFTLVMFLFFAMVHIASSQTLIRSSLSSVGGSYIYENILYRQTIGQSSNTESFESEELRLSQGFQQQELFLTNGSIGKKCDISVSPNPVSDILTVNLQEDIRGRISIFDMLGQQQKKLGIDGPNTEIDVTNLPDGIYLITVMSDGQQCTQRIIVK